MAVPPPRQVHVQELPGFCQSVSLALSAPDSPVEELPMTAVCIQCHIRLNRREMALLAAPAAADEPPRVARVRQGYCARNECPSYFYRVECEPREGVDWSQLLPVAEAASAVQRAEAAEAAAALEAQRRAARIRQLRRVTLGVGIVLVLLLVRQWFMGGRIPLLREPEQFQIDPASLEQAPRR